MSISFKKVECNIMPKLKCYQTNTGFYFTDSKSTVMEFTGQTDDSSHVTLARFLKKHFDKMEFPSIYDPIHETAPVLTYFNERGFKVHAFSMSGLEYLCQNLQGHAAFQNRAKFLQLIEDFKGSKINKHPSSSDEGPVPKRRAITGSIPYHVAKVMQKQLVDKVATSVSDSMKPVQSQITAVGQDVTSMGQDIKHIQATASNTQGQLHMMGEGMVGLGQTLISGQQRQDFMQSKLLHAGSHVLGGIEKLGQSTVTIEKQVKEELKTVREKNGKQEYAVSCLNKTIREKDSLLQKKDGQLQKKDEKLYEYQEVIKTFHRDFGTVDSKLVKLGAAVKELQASHAEIKSSIQSLVTLLSA